MKRLLILLVSCQLAAGLAVGTVSGAPDAAVADHALGRPGYLIISAARDTTGYFQETAGPGPGQHSLVWDCGQLVLPDSVTLEPFGAKDLGVRTGAALRGQSGTGFLEFRDGEFGVDQPLLLTDGVVSLYVADGELEIRGAQLRYRSPPQKAAAADHRVADPRAGFLFLSGIVIMIVVLMRRARLQTRKTSR